MVIAGPRGVVGRGLLEYFPEDGWEVLSVSRKPLGFPNSSQHLEVDLLDRRACEAAADALKDVTHVVYAAVAEQPAGWRPTGDSPDQNSRMLQNLLETILPRSPRFERVVFTQGSRVYGTHLATPLVPSLESQPRTVEPNFYYAQEDLLRQLSAGHTWSWTALRLPTVVGLSVGSGGTKLVGSVAVYAAISRELGLPLRFPGTNWSRIFQTVDSRLLARAILWAATSPQCAGETFNITNGDCLSWSVAWPHLERVLGARADAPQPIRLAETMPSRSSVWRRIVEKCGLEPTELDDLTSWHQADWLFHATGSYYLSTIKARRHGFHECMDSLEMLDFWVGEWRRRHLIPDMAGGRHA